MFERSPLGSARSVARLDGSLIVPALIGVFWLALAIASLAELDELGRTLAQARAAKDRPAQVSAPIASACPNATGTFTAN